MAEGTEAGKEVRTAGEAGWHASRYNLFAREPGTNRVIAANLYKGTCAACSPIETHLISVVERLRENHPMIGPLARRGLIANFDERAALETMGRAVCAAPMDVRLTICPTMGCNFDCPYCFEGHRPGVMSPEVQDDVVALAGRMLEASGAQTLLVTWFGGEPLLAPGVIESLSGRLAGLAEGRGAEYRASIVTNGYLLTAEVAEMLGRCRVSSAQVTLDGVGAAHDATRHLAGGGPTFERIVSNLRECKLPFKVSIRHNVHAGNRGEAEALERLVREIAQESGNDLSYAPAPVWESVAANERGKQVDMLRDADAVEADIRLEASRFSAGRGHHCGANNLWCLGIDETGGLHKCRDTVSTPSLSFGTAHDWDPADPIGTASNPENLTWFLNSVGPVPDEECRDCVWLPLCVGGCPYQRLTVGRRCPAFKDSPEAFVLAVHARMEEEQASAAREQGA